MTRSKEATSIPIVVEAPPSGMCDHHDLPRFMCGCVKVEPRQPKLPFKQHRPDSHLGAVGE